MTQSGTPGSYEEPPVGPPADADTTRRRRRRRRRTGIIAAIIALLLIIVILLLFFPRPAATVKLTAVSKTLSTSLTILGRPLTSTQQDSGQGTPTGPQSKGTNATGTLTFDNDTLSTITIPAGTHITTNSTGQEVITDEDAVVPPDPATIPGVKSGVRAHAAKVGTDGNIHALDISKPCCTDQNKIAGIRVFNDAAFTGGSNPQTSSTVQQSDVDKVATSLKTSLTQKAQTDIQSQLKSGETLASSTVVCPTELANITSTAAVGASVANFTVTVSLKCADVAYSQQQAIDQLRQALTKLLDTGFLLVGNPTPQIGQPTVEPSGNVDVPVSGNGTEQYQLTSAQKSSLASSIAHKSKSDAVAFLKKQTGVTDASISITGPVIDLTGDNTLPDDTGAINFTVNSASPQNGPNLK